jgi:hypothetical protein
MRFLDEQQSRLGLDLCIGQRTLRQCDLRAAPVEDALRGCVALTARAFQRVVEQPEGQLIPLRDPQHRQSQQPGSVLRGGREAGHQRRLRVVHYGVGGRSPHELLVSFVDPRYGLKTRMTPGLVTKAGSAANFVMLHV